MDEVRFDRMVPAQVLARRQACNLAYLPVGALEWHGAHMPFGTDYLTVQHIAEQGARRFGGVVFPPMYYGDVRYILQECRAEWRQTYVRDMQVPEAFAAAFPLQDDDGSPGYKCPTQPDDGPAAELPLEFTRAGQEREFIRQIAAAMLSIHLYGFRRILVLPGHGGNPGCCQKALEVYRQNVRRRSAFGEPAKVASWFYIRGVKDLEPVLKKHWLHADKWEGSVTMAAAPDTVHLEYLPKDPKAIPPAFLGHPYLTETDGYNPDRRADWPSYDAFDPRHGTSEAYGREQVEKILEGMNEVVAQLLAE